MVPRGSWRLSSYVQTQQLPPISDVEIRASHILQKWKPPHQLPPLSTPIPDLNGMLATALKRDGGEGADRRGQWRHTQQYANPNTLTPPLLSICKWMVTIFQVLHVHKPTSTIRRASHVDATCDDGTYETIRTSHTRCHPLIQWACQKL
jgi:hypothetical protein